jgi:hypothetical protein
MVPFTRDGFGAMRIRRSMIPISFKNAKMGLVELLRGTHFCL